MRFTLEYLITLEFLFSLDSVFFWGLTPDSLVLLETFERGCWSIEETAHPSAPQGFRGNR